MNKPKQITLILAFLSVPALFAETQGERRTANPWHFTFAPLPGVYSLALSYNMNPQWEGGLYLHKNNTAKETRVEENAVGLALVEEERTLPQGFLFLRHYPFETPFFASLYAGRGGGGSVRRTEIIQFQPDLSPYNGIFFPAYTVSERQHYSVGAGIGFKWNFANGLLFGFEAGLSAKLNPQNDVYVYNDLRTLLHPESTRNPEAIFILQKALEENHKPNKQGSLLLLHFGLSF